MGLRIATNTPAVTVGRLLNRNSEELNKSAERLASGERIVSPADDIAGLSIAGNLKAQIGSMGQAARNANDAISFVQVAEGGLSEIGDILVRLRELSIQSASDTVDDRTREYIHQEGRSLVQEIARISGGTNFNGVPLLNPESGKGVLEFQVGINNSENDRIEFNIENLDLQPESLGVEGLNLESQQGALDAVGKLDEGMAHLYGGRSQLGVLQQRLQSAVRTGEETKENLMVARSRIADTDMAEEASRLVRHNIVNSAGIAVLAQANTMQGHALKLI